MTRSPMPATCRGCGTPLYAKGKPVPGARRHSGRGLCSVCWKHDTGVNKPRIRWTHCRACGTALHPSGRPEPGAVEHAGHGLCRPCRHKTEYRPRENRRRPMPPVCDDCGRTLRRQGDPPIPGTVVFSANGCCGSCWNARRKGTTATPHTEWEACADCHTPMATRSKVRPGQVAHRSAGLCDTCFSRAESARRRAAAREDQLIAWMLGGAA